MRCWQETSEVQSLDHFLGSADAMDITHNLTSMGIVMAQDVDMEADTVLVIGALVAMAAMAAMVAMVAMEALVAADCYAQV